MSRGSHDFLSGFEDALYDAVRLRKDPDDIYYDIPDFSAQEVGWIQGMFFSGMEDWFWPEGWEESIEYALRTNVFIVPIKRKVTK